MRKALYIGAILLLLAGCGREQPKPDQAPAKPAADTPAGKEIAVKAPVSVSTRGSDGLPLVYAISKCGKYRIEVSRTFQRPGGHVSIYMLVQALDPRTGKAASRERQESLMLNSPRPEVLAVAADGTKNTDNTRYWCNWHYGRSENFEVNNLAFGKPQSSIRQLDLAFHIYVTSKWRKLEFPGLGKGQSKDMLCGAFQLTVEGKERSFLISAGHMSKYDKERRAFEKETGLHSLPYPYAFEKLEATDAACEQLSSVIICYMGGSGGGTYITRDPSRHAPDMDWTKGKPITYPVRIQLKMPQAGHTDKVEFSLRDVVLPTGKEIQLFSQKWDAVEHARDSRQPPNREK